MWWFGTGALNKIKKCIVRESDLDWIELKHTRSSWIVPVLRPQQQFTTVPRLNHTCPFTISVPFAQSSSAHDLKLYQTLFGIWRFLVHISVPRPSFTSSDRCFLYSISQLPVTPNLVNKIVVEPLSTKPSSNPCQRSCLSRPFSIRVWLLHRRLSTSRELQLCS